MFKWKNSSNSSSFWSLVTNPTIEAQLGITKNEHLVFVGPEDEISVHVSLNFPWSYTFDHKLDNLKLVEWHVMTQCAFSSLSYCCQFCDRHCKTSHLDAWYN